MKKKITLVLIPILTILMIGATITPVFAIPKETEQNFTYRIITGSDACGSFGAYRTIQMNFKELEDNEVESSITIDSVFFNSDLGKVGEGQITKKIVRNNNGSSEQIPLQNSIQCVPTKTPSAAEEKFDFFLNLKEKSGYPDLPPI